MRCCVVSSVGLDGLIARFIYNYSQDPNGVAVTVYVPSEIVLVGEATFKFKLRAEADGVSLGDGIFVRDGVSSLKLLKLR